MRLFLKRENNFVSPARQASPLQNASVRCESIRWDVSSSRSMPRRWGTPSRSRFCYVGRTLDRTTAMSLPPIPRHPHITVMPVCPSSGDPNCSRARWHGPIAVCPNIAATNIRVITGNPNMSGTWPDNDNFTRWPRRTKPNKYLRGIRLPNRQRDGKCSDGK